MDGAPFGVPHSLRVCVKCKGFEKSIPSRGGKAGMILSSLQSTPPAPTPFVPLFAPALHPDDNASRIDLESFGGELIRASLTVALQSPDVVKELVSAGITEETAMRCIQRQWEDALWSMIQTTMSLVDPNSRAGWADKLDFLHYVKIKTVPGGIPKLEWPAGNGQSPAAKTLAAFLPGDCEFLDGVVFRKSLPHKLMRDKIDNPRVLLLDDALEFDAANDLSKLDNLVDQEDQYTKILAKKIAAMTPDVVFSTKNTSRSAWEILRSYANVTLVPNVKPSVMNRLSRMTGGVVLPSVNHIDKMMDWQLIGKCSKFETRSLLVAQDESIPTETVAAETARFRDRRNRVTYMVVEGSSTSPSATAAPGCTVLLRGGSQFLKFMKAVLRWSLYCAYNIRLERCVHYDFGMHPLQAGEQSTDHSVSVETVLQGNETTPVAVTVEHAALTQSGSSAPLIMSSSPGVQYCLREEIGCTRFVPTVCHADLVQRSLLPSNDAARDGRGSGHCNLIPHHVGVAWSYQSLLVNHVDTVDGVQCKDPALLRIRFYTAADWSMKHFLDRRCFDVHNICAHCKKPNHRHVITYSHLTGRVEIHIFKKSHQYIGGDSEPENSAPIVDDLPVVMSDLMVSSNPQSSSSRRVSSFGLKDLPTPPPLPNLDGMSRDVVSVCAMCTQCMRCVSPWRPMSRGSLQYSFGKFLELSFYNTSVAARDKVCTHNPRDHHVRFFGKAAALVAFKYVPLSAYKILRQVTIRFDREWAGQARADDMLRLRDTILERSAKQMATLGDMSKQASRLECEQTFVTALERLRERVTSLRDQCVEAIRVISGEAPIPANDAASSDTASGRSPSHRTTSGRPVAGNVDVNHFLASCRYDVLAVTRFQQQWSVSCHAIDMDLDRFQAGLLKVASALKHAAPIPVVSPPPLPTGVSTSLPPETMLPLATPPPVDSISSSMPSDSVLPAVIVTQEADRTPSEMTQTEANSEAASVVSAPVSGDVVGPLSGEGMSARPDTIGSNSDTDDSDNDTVTDLTPVTDSRHPSAPETSSVPRINARRRVSATEMVPPEVTDPLKLVPPSPQGVHAYLPPGLQLSSITVHNTMLSSAIAYSLASAPYWRQMAEIMQSAKDRFQDFTQDGGSADRRSSRLDTVSTLDSEDGGSAYARQQSVGDTFDDVTLPRQHSEPGLPLNVHGRRRSVSVVVTPTSARLRGLIDTDAPSRPSSATQEPNHPLKRVPSVGSVSSPREIGSGHGVPRQRRRSLGEINQSRQPLPGTQVMNGSGPDSSQQPRAPVPIAEIAASFSTSAKQTAFTFMGAVDGVWSRLEERTKAAALASESKQNRATHRVRSQITATVNETVPGASASAVAALSIPIPSVLPDVLPDSVASSVVVPFDLSVAKLPSSITAVRRTDSGPSTYSKPRAPETSANCASASGVSSPPISSAASSTGPETQWGSDSAFGCVLPLSDPKSMLISDVQGDIIHTVYDKTEGNEATFVVTSYWAMQFHGLRDLVCENPRSYVQSLAFCKKWATSGGKSGASFELTQDERFVVKYVKTAELEMFVHNGAKFFAHMHSVLFKGQQSLMARYMGAYKVTLALANGKKVTSCMVVLENLFYRRNIPDGFKFDLKGKNRSNRAKVMAAQQQAQQQQLQQVVDGGAGSGAPPNVTQPASTGGVLLDDDFLEWTGGYPTVLDEPSKLFLNDAVREDTRFLASLKVIDYSLLVAVDAASGEISLGLIDYVRRYDWMSRMESGVKRTMAGAEPTVVSPQRYRDRFCHAMERYFVCVPNKFTQPNVLATNTAEPAAKPAEEEELRESSREKDSGDNVSREHSG